MVEISKADWKLFRERVSSWQEHYMEGLLKEYIEMLSAPGKASEHFWELDKRIRQDRKHPGVIIDLNKSTAVWDIAMYVHDGVITMGDLRDFCWCCPLGARGYGQPFDSAKLPYLVKALPLR